MIIENDEMANTRTIRKRGNALTFHQKQPRISDETERPRTSGTCTAKFLPWKLEHNGLKGEHHLAATRHLLTSLDALYDAHSPVVLRRISALLLWGSVSAKRSF